MRTAGQNETGIKLHDFLREFGKTLQGLKLGRVVRINKKQRALQIVLISVHLKY